MSIVEDPVADLSIEVREITPLRSASDCRRVEVSWSEDPTGERRETAELSVSAVSSGTRVDALVYDPGLAGVPFEIVENLRGLKAPAVIRPGPGRKAVAVIAVPFGDWLRIQPITGRRSRPEPAAADGHELELVAAITDRLEAGTLLSDLAEAGLIVRITVDRLSAPLGALELADGAFRWTETR